MVAAGVGEAPSRRRLSPEEIVLLAKSSSGALPSPDSHGALLSNLLRLPSPSVPLALYVSSLLTLISRSDPSFPVSSLLSSLLISFIRLFRSRQIPRDGDSCRLFHLFSLHLSTLDMAQLCSVIDVVLSDLSEIVDSDDALVLDFLPRCLDLLVITGSEESVDSILDRILNSDWSKSVLVKIIALLREFPASTRIRAMELLDKAFGGLKDIDIQDLPSVAYQLLLLASKGFNKRTVINGILSFFGSGRVKAAASILRQVEGTVLMHFNFAVKQDPTLGKEVMRIMRCDVKAFNHFAVAVLLSIARVRRHNESSINLLRSLVINSYNEYRFSRDCKWLPNGIKEECLSTAKLVEKSMMRAINENNSGREYIVPSSVQLGFALLESVDVRMRERSDHSEELMGAEELGIWILKTNFEVHDMARNEIIEQCKIRTLSLKPQESYSIIKLLGTLIQRYPYPMLEQNGRLKDFLDYFSFMHSKLACSIIHSMLPLVRFSRDLQDYMILVVRKAMFRKEDGVRLAATNAAIDLVLSDARSKRNRSAALQEPSSQASCSQQAEVPRKMGLGLFQELSGLLRRCLSQQAEMKEVIYRGFMKLVFLDPLLSGAVFDFLWPHFLRYYKEDATFPLVIDSCIKEENGKACIGEPLDCLLSCVSWIFLLQPAVNREQSDHSWTCFDFSLSQDNDGGRTSRECFSNALKKIQQALTNENLKDSCSLQGDRRKCYLRILSRMVEVFANVNAMELEKGGDTEKSTLEKQIVNLSVLYNSLENDSPHKPTEAPKRSPLESSDSSSQIKKTLLTTASIRWILLSAVEFHDSSESDGQKTSNHYLDLAGFALKTCLSKLRYFYLRNENYDDGDDALNTIIDGDIKLLGRPILQLIWQLKVDTMSESQKKKEPKGKKKLLHLSLVCLKELLKICLRKEESFFALTKEMATEVESTTEEESDLQHMKNVNYFLDKWIKPLYSELLSHSLFLESAVLSEVVLMIGRRLPEESREALGMWAVDFCRISDWKNSTAVSGLMEISIQLLPPPNDLITAQEMARELTLVNGSEDQQPVEASETYPVINRSTGTVVASSLLRLVESVIVDLDWSLSKLNALTSDRLTLEEATYSRSEALVNTLSHVVQMNLTDPQAEQLLKMAARFYKILSLAAKLRVAPKGSTQLPPGRKFQDLSEVTCRNLTAPLYNFLSLIQRNQREAHNGGKGLCGRIKRENKWVPELVFRIEDYEKHLIQLSRLTGVNLLRQAKNSTARDFKILNAGRVDRVDREDDEAQEDDEREGSDKGLTPEVSAGEDTQSEEDGQQLLQFQCNKKRRRVVSSSEDEDES